VLWLYSFWPCVTLCNWVQLSGAWFGTQVVCAHKLMPMLLLLRLLRTAAVPARSHWPQPNSMNAGLE
jgi:hypothetical protein